MYDIKSPKVYVSERAAAIGECVPRIEAMVRAVGSPEAVTFADSDVPDLIAENGLADPDWWSKDYKMIPEAADPIVVLNAVRFDGLDEQVVVDDALARCPKGTPRQLVKELISPGWRGGPTPAIRNGELICRSAYEFRLMYGCLHRCLYCEQAGVPVVNVPLNVEEVIDKGVSRLVAEQAGQKLFRYQACLSDSQCFEPECGATRALVEFFATLPDQYMLIHTTSANLDHLLDLDHKGHTVVCWSLTSETVSRRMEKRSSSTTERIEMARRCQEAGYTVRFKFKPIIPIRNWRDEARDMIRRLFERTSPDLLTMCSLMWFTPEELEHAFDTNDFDPEYIQAMYDARDEMAGRACAPFPHWARAQLYAFYIDEIRKASASVPVSLSTETREMWREFEPALGFGPGRFVCACGPHSTPGRRVLERAADIEGLEADRK